MLAGPLWEVLIRVVEHGLEIQLQLNSNFSSKDLEASKTHPNCKPCFDLFLLLPDRRTGIAGSGEQLRRLRAHRNISLISCEVIG